MQLAFEARTTPSKSPVHFHANVESEGQQMYNFDSLVEKTETHILVGLFLLCVFY
jgi:hypothetical protein